MSSFRYRAGPEADRKAAVSNGLRAEQEGPSTKRPHRDDDVRHVAVLGDHLQSLNRLAVADDILKLQRPILLDPVDARREDSSDRARQLLASSTTREIDAHQGISYATAEAATLAKAPSLGFDDEATADDDPDMAEGELERRGSRRRRVESTRVQVEGQGVGRPCDALLARGHWQDRDEAGRTSCSSDILIEPTRHDRI